MPGRKRCVVVADGTMARILLAGPRHGAGYDLIEHSELENCTHRRSGESQRARAGRNGGPETRHAQGSLEHRPDNAGKLDQRFAAALAQHIATIVGEWRSGCVIIAAAPGTLGMLRELVQNSLPDGVRLQALAKDYISLSAPELAERLNF